jgi:pimeloyl-ACP methyl ester carboxylesterase/alpha-ketoglutarate-dependent taurine dioxygenase
VDWLFLRGLSREQRHWGSFPGLYARTVPGARVHCLDLPGSGAENGRASPSSIEAIAADVRARWLALRGGHAGPWGLFAISLGGMVAMAWCAAHPGDFARLVLVSTSAGDLSRPWKRFDPRVLPGGVRALAARDPVRREARVLSITTRLVADVPAVAAEWARYHEARPMASADVLRQLLAAARFHAPARVEVPALILAGGRDPMTDPSCARMLASHLGVPFDVHPEAGHELALDAPDWLAGRVAAWIETTSRGEQPPSERAVRVAPLGGPGGGGLPLVIEPAPGADRGTDALVRWMGEHRAFLEERLVAHGAVLLRGFAVADARAFERVARATGAELENRYLGTSPRDALTDHVFSASELPAFYPIPQHCEMSFVARPPRRVFFCCLVPSGGPGGETPLADFRRVYRDLDPEVRARFVAKGVRNVRNYAGPGGGARLDLWKLKRWDEMFGTPDRAEVERLCRENGFDFAWRPGGALRLVNVQPAARLHPGTGEPVWFNHAQVFHLSAVPAEYRRIAARLGRLRYAALAGVAEAAVRVRSRTSGDLDQAMHCTYGDGTPIPDGDMDRVRDAIWKNMVFFKWRQGDVLVIDNAAVAHGRMPYEGPRKIAVAWA